MQLQVGTAGPESVHSLLIAVPLCDWPTLHHKVIVRQIAGEVHYLPLFHRVLLQVPQPSHNVLEQLVHCWLVLQVQMWRQAECIVHMKEWFVGFNRPLTFSQKAYAHLGKRSKQHNAGLYHVIWCHTNWPHATHKFSNFPCSWLPSPHHICFLMSSHHV